MTVAVQNSLSEGLSPAGGGWEKGGHSNSKKGVMNPRKKKSEDLVWI